MAQAAARAADLKSHQQVMSISESALEIADSDEARAPFWEMVIEASGRMADLERAERHAVRGDGSLPQTGDKASLTRVTGASPWAWPRTTSPSGRSSCSGPWSMTISAAIRSSPGRRWCTPAV